MSKLAPSQKRGKTPLFIIFTTVLIDLIGFGMVIPLIGLYGRHYGAQGVELALLGGIYSLMQFFFAPFWGSISDRIGRRPVLLISLAGSTISYLLFGLATNTFWLFVARAFGGIFAANISTAQAYIADITAPQDRAKGMGLIGAAFGLGFTLGPPLGGIASAHLGLSAPGLIAAGICGTNFLAAIFRLPESYPPEKREKSKNQRRWKLLPLENAARAFRSPALALLLGTFFLNTFAFSTMEQTLSLLFQAKFGFDTGESGLKTGMLLMVAGLLGAFIQGGMIRRLVPKFGEIKLLFWGLFLNGFSLLIFPFCPTYGLYYLFIIPLSLGSSLINPTLSSLISKNASKSEQGSTLGISQGLGSLARATGPFCGLSTFSLTPALPYYIAGGITFGILLMNLRHLRSTVEEA